VEQAIYQWLLIRIEIEILCRRQQQWRLTMNILKLALLASLRIAFFGALKAALFAYTLFLSAIDTCHAVTAGGRLSLEGDSLRLPESKVHRAVSQPALSASLLSAITYARRSASLR
jgi:hypothetical protein